MLLIFQKVIWDEEVRVGMQDKRLSTDSWSDDVHLPYAISQMKVCSQFALFVLTNEPDHWYYDYDQVMMISDTIAGRMFTIIYNDILPVDIPGKIQHGLLEKIYKVFDTLFSKCKNEAYIQIVRCEPICMAFMLKKFDRLK